MDNNQLIEISESLCGEQVIIKLNDESELQGLLNSVKVNTGNYNIAIELLDSEGKGILISLSKIISVEPIQE